LNFNIDVIFSDCEIGDIYDPQTKMYYFIYYKFLLSNHSCETCSTNHYSLDDPYHAKNCSRCLDNALCPGGSKIAPLPGYWRLDSQTTKILKCPEASACLLGICVNSL